MGAPQATESTQQDDAEGPRSHPGRSRSPLVVHLMSATRAKIEICPKWLAHLFSHLSCVATGNVGAWYHFVIEKYSEIPGKFLFERKLGDWRRVAAYPRTCKFHPVYSRSGRCTDVSAPAARSLKKIPHVAGQIPHFWLFWT